MFRLWFHRIFWLATTGVLALGATEGFTRALMPQNRDTVLDILVPDETVGYIYEAGTGTYERGRDYDVPFVTNSLGLRDREYGDKGTDYRVLLIGNSFCVSHGVEIENSLSRALERTLQVRFDAAGRNRRVRVVNTANAGYNTWNYWRSYERWAPVFRPDAIVVGFVAAREHRTDHEDVRFLIRDGLLVNRYRTGETPADPGRSQIQSARKFLARNSDLYVLIRNFFFYNERVQKVFDQGRGLGDESRLLAPYRNPVPEPVAAGRTRAFDYLARLADHAHGDGLPVVVVSIPQKEEVLDQSWAVVAERAGKSGTTIRRNLPATALAEYCRSAGLPIVDPREKLAHLGPEAFFRHDNHWNAAGIAATADLIASRWDDLVGEDPATRTP